MLTTSPGWFRELLGIILGGLVACMLQAAIFQMSEPAEHPRVEIEVYPDALSPPRSDPPQVAPRVGAPFTSV